MRKIAIARPNQSLADIILMEYGTLEGGMAVMAANDTAISYSPEPGSEWIMPELDAALSDRDVLSYLRQNKIVIGTLSAPVLDYAVLLKPIMHVVTSAAGAPHVVGYYQYSFAAAPGFVHALPLMENYSSNNKVFFATEERYALGYPATTDIEDATTAMPAMSVPYKLTWTIGNGYMLVWSDLSASIKTVTFKDIEGNSAYVAPLIVLDNVSQGLVEYLLAEMDVAIVSATSGAIVLRLTRSHPYIAINDFRDHTMEWLADAADGVPDPDDPLNQDKTILTLTPGKYTLGVRTRYRFNFFTPPIIYPPSEFTMVIGVG